MVLAVAFGQGLFVLLYFAAVFLHELAHCVVAKRLFYHTEQIKLGIFGATLVGQFDNMSVVDTIKIALAGPLCNIVWQFVVWHLGGCGQVFTQLPISFL